MLDKVAPSALPNVDTATFEQEGQDEWESQARSAGSPAGADQTVFFCSLIFGLRSPESGDSWYT